MGSSGKNNRDEEVVNQNSIGNVTRREEIFPKRRVDPFVRSEEES